MVGFRVLKTAITSELIANLGPERWMLLCIIAAHMDGNGECFPSQKTLAILTNKTQCTISRWVKSLLEFQWNGEPILLREMRKPPNSMVEYSHYKIMPAAQVIASPIAEVHTPLSETNMPHAQVHNPPAEMNVPHAEVHNPLSKMNITHAQVHDPIHPVYTKNNGIYDPPVIYCNNDINGNTVESTVDETTNEEPTEDPMTAQDVIQYFCDRYREKYNANYSPNWARDMKLVKTKLIGQYSPEQLRQIVDISVEMYEKWGTLSKFPRPSIAALTSWMPEKALAMAQQREARMNIPEHGGRTGDELLALLDRI
nr:helix-turn-helix domain-containing protein [Heliobacterium chlorum]